MVIFNLGYTAPINRAGQSPILTSSQVWTGLQLKVRHPGKFVPVIDWCKVLSEDSTYQGSRGPDGTDMVTVVRHVSFRPGCGIGPPDGQAVKEVCNQFPPCRVDFHQEDGAKIGNYISQGPSGEPSDLLLTFMYEWRHSDVATESEEARILEGKHRNTAKASVESTIETIRQLVVEGSLT